jgi:nitrate/TMAO reductase-like tetraheme cytochrome c subunit
MRIRRATRTGRKSVRLFLASIACAALAAALGGALARPTSAAQATQATQGTQPAQAAQTTDPHAKLFAESQYPSASQCASCHQGIYNEWSSSNHAYASISPVFHKFEQKINDLSQGTIGYFCLRCHAGVGTSMNERRDLPLTARSQVSREGVTCITCHRVSENYGRVNGERRVDPGDIFAPVTGPTGAPALAEVIANKGRYAVKTNAADPGPGQNIHTAAFKFDQINRSEFCVSCHQVAVQPGIKLEVVWEQYRASPAAKKGVTCQDCHMGKNPGVADGYSTGPAATVAGVPINATRKHTNHAFYGPGYPTAHPGVFPHNPAAQRWTMDQWLKFDYRAGWGTDGFEAKLPASQANAFPAEWKEPDDRYDARKVVTANIAKLEEKREARRKLMENGSHIDGPFFAGDPRSGQSLGFRYRLTNTNPGHNMPSGSLGAQPELWLNVALIDPSGKRVWESGYVDSHGDMADEHSLDVRAGKVPYDGQLFNLQTKFLTTNVKGTDREMYLPINLDIDQLPFIRPAGQPITVMNHPPFIRMEARSIPPLSSRDASYVVPGNLLTKPGTYRLAVRLRSRAEPIYFMKFIGSTTEMERAMNEWMLDIHPYTVEFVVK